MLVGCVPVSLYRYAWVNGVQVSWSGSVLPSAPGALFTSLQGASSIVNSVARGSSWLGKSDGGQDGNAAVTIDAFRVYDYALPPALISSLASAYGLLGVATSSNASVSYTASSEDTRVAAALASNKQPIFAASFAVDPAPFVGGRTNFQWNATDANDDAATAASHSGLIILNGQASSYIDLTTTYGPQSCGLLLPIFGGAGSGTFPTTQGVTFEMVHSQTHTASQHVQPVGPALLCTSAVGFDVSHRALLPLPTLGTVLVRPAHSVSVCVLLCWCVCRW